MAPEEHPLLSAEVPFNCKANREMMCQVSFESFNMPALYDFFADLLLTCLARYLAPTPVLVMYATGKSTGLVVECGDGKSVQLPRS